MNDSRATSDEFQYRESAWWRSELAGPCIEKVDAARVYISLYRKAGSWAFAALIVLSVDILVMAWLAGRTHGDATQSLLITNIVWTYFLCSPILIAGMWVVAHRLERRAADVEDDATAILTKTEIGAWTEHIRSLQSLPVDVRDLLLEDPLPDSARELEELISAFAASLARLQVAMRA